MPAPLTPHPNGAHMQQEAPIHVEQPFYSHLHEEGMDLQELFDLLIRGRWLILGITLLIALPVTVWTMSQPNQYSSYALVLVEKQQSGMGEVLSQGAPWMSNTPNLENELLLLEQSLPLAKKAAERVMEYEHTRYGEPLSVLASDASGGTPSLQTVAMRLQGRVSASRMNDQSDAVRISSTTTSPEEAQLYANAYADAFVALSQESSRAGVSASRDFLETQVARQQDSLQRLDEQVRRFMLQERAIALDQETSQLVGQIAQLESERDANAIQIEAAQATIGALEQELSRIEPRLADRIASGVDEQIRVAQERITQLGQQLEQYYQNDPSLREAENPPADIRRIQREIESQQDRVRRLSQQLTEESIAAGGGGPGDASTGFSRVVELRRQLTNSRIELNRLQSERNVLLDRIRQYETEFNNIPGQSIELAQLQRDRLAAERLYGALDERLQETRVAEQSKLGYASMIRPAFASSVPVSPNRVRNILMGVLIGLGLGVVAAIAQVHLDRRIYRPDDLEKQKVVHIGTIPNTTELIQEEFGGAERVEVDGRKISTRLVALLHPMATATETYRALRTSVQFSRPDTDVRSILITSANPGEGKSVTATNLGVVMAQADRRVLLVDADLRRPTLHSKLGLPREPGLVQALFDDVPMEKCVHTVADRFDVLTAGMNTPNPAELVGSRRMRSLIEEIQEHYDVILFDAPPVLVATDAVLLSTQVDATLMVARAGVTKTYELESGLSALRDVGAPVIGTVLNGFDLSQTYGYKYKYAYRYGSAYGYGHPSTVEEDLDVADTARV